MIDRDAVLAALHRILGKAGIVPGENWAAFVSDWRGLYHGNPLAIVRPASTAEVAAVMTLCAQHGIPVVPQGGNTGMVGGGVPGNDGREIVMNLSRMNRLRAIDPLDMTMIVDAGMTLKAAQDAALEKNCRFPVSIGSEGTAQIGGIIATNAGGNTTIRYGNTREQVLGLEVVLPDGTVWNGLRRLRKDNAGYCLRHLFTGSEGTLGIITAATLQLVPAPVATAAAFCAIGSPEQALELFDLFRRHDASAVQAFEYMSAAGLDLVLSKIPDTRMPVETTAGHYVLVELASSRDDIDLAAMIESRLEIAFERGIVADAAIAQTDAQRRSFWRLREEHSEAQRLSGPSIKNDVSVPVSRIPDLLRDGIAAASSVLPGIRPVPFGHIGDGNIHFNLLAPEGMPEAAFKPFYGPLTAAVNDVVDRLEGSFAAEHGIGRIKTAMLAERRSVVEVELMRTIRWAIDPQQLLNPGRVC